VAIGAPASIVAAHYSIVWVAVAFTVTGWIVVPLSFFFVHRITGLGALRQFVALRGILIGSGLMVAAVIAVQHALDPVTSTSVVLLAGVLTGVAVYLTTIMVLDRTLLTSAMRDISRREAQPKAAS
jgi:hypothetical protein